MDNQKINAKISIDCNFNYFGFDKPTISSFEIEYFALKERDIVIGYQDEQEWEGIVRYDSSSPEEMKWYIELNLKKEYVVSSERAEGRDEGARSAIPIGEIRGESAVVTAMLADGIDIEIVEKYTRLSKTRLKNILQNIKK
ncbi:MAG TPA: hypothetical protein DDW65_12555 [Firmicutes bacterium]|jgi:hypothetical protein|nr:hypothetical protein [Bacillota bacterium]